MKARYFGGTMTAVAAAMLVAPAAHAQTAPAAPHAPKLRSTTAGKTVDAGSVTPYYNSINPYYRNIRGFWGELNPFYRNIRGFWGDVGPFYRNIRGFWGDLDPMYRNIRGFGTVPEYAAMGDFWEKSGALWTEIDAGWAATGTPDYVALTEKLRLLETQSRTYFGAAVTSQTGGKTFNAGFSDALFAKYGINLNDPASLAKLAPAERSHFFMDWYDGLMNFSGTDHADHWMKTANWTPHLTQVQGSGGGTTIGLIDFFVAGDTDIQSKTIYNGGVSTFSNGHGAAVASLMVSAHDGKGVMGIAPNAKVAAFNPFDATGTADWASVIQGIGAVTAKGASVVNLSLGVSGSTFDGGWRDVFKSKAATDVKDSTIYVIAAGNDGVTQTADVNMKDTFDSTYLVVGSVDPLGNISEFSNRPGTVCLLEDRDCKRSLSLKESGLLMNRFIVAPGELILVSDDKGGVIRHSGTSFSAPLVSGAIALIHDRWPWMKKKPRDVAQMILGSAKDLGAPGVDAVYGVGLLDVEASQAPLNFGSLKYYSASTDAKATTEVKVTTLAQTGVQSSWETKNMYFTAFEKLVDAERDFLIPLSSRLVGLTRNGEYFQDFIYDRMVDWLNAPTTTSTPAPGPRGLTDLGATNALPNAFGWKMGMTARVANPGAVRQGSNLRMATALHMAEPSGRIALTVGQGDGAATVGSQGGFGFASDYDTQNGGVNPLLGFASGGAYANAVVKLSNGLHLSLGATEQTRSHGRDLEGISRADDRPAIAGLARYKASAANLRVDYQLTSGINLSTAYTRLDEASGLLGIRSLERRDLAGGSTTDSVTIGADVKLPMGLSLSASGTRAHTSSNGRDATLNIADGGLVGSSYQLSLAKQGLLGRADTLRLSVAQPLTIDRGGVDFTEMQVVDRQTGETGLVTSRFDLAPTSRRYVFDAAYATGLLGNLAEVSAFGRAEIGGTERPTGYVGGLRGRIAF